jgi:hypothetical protein
MSSDERRLREAAEKIGAKPTDSLESVIARLEAAGVDLGQHGRGAGRANTSP